MLKGKSVGEVGKAANPDIEALTLAMPVAAATQLAG
jgi:hypothetical protein